MIAQLGERQTEDLKVPGSIPGRGRFFFTHFSVTDKENRQTLKMDGNFDSVKLLYKEVQNMLRVRQAI